jgi:hypothetical protein
METLNLHPSDAGDAIPYWTSEDAAVVLEQAQERAAREAYAEMMADADFPPGTILSLVA